jgi:hypothetical protein
MRYTWFGDADINGTVDSVDFNMLSGHFSQSGTHWAQGDFNYDGTTDTIDFNLLSGDFSQGGFPV